MSGRDNPSARLSVQQFEVRVWDADGPGGGVFDEATTFEEAATFTDDEGFELDTWTGNNVVEDVSLDRVIGAPIGQATINLFGDVELDALDVGHVALVFFEHELTDGFEFLDRLRMGRHTVGFTPGGDVAVGEVHFENWLFAILESRRWSGRIRNQPLDEAIQRILDAEAPAEVDLEVTLGAEDMPTVTETFDGERLRTAIDELVGDDAILVADGQTLRVEPLPESVGGTVTDADIANPEKRVTPDGLTTHIRIDGGRTGIRLPEAINPDVDEYRETTERLQIQLPIAEPELNSVAIRSRHDDADGQLVARLQPDDGTSAPIAPDDRQRDRASDKLDATFVSPDGTSEFEFPDHQLTARNPWLIIEQQSAVDDPEPFEIGGVVEEGSFRPATPNVEARKDVTIKDRDEDAASRYGRRDARLRDESIGSRDEAEVTAGRELSRRSSPTVEISGTALSDDVFDLSLLDARTLDLDRLKIDEPFVVAEIRDSISSGGRLRRDVIFAQPPGFDPE